MIGFIYPFSYLIGDKAILRLVISLYISRDIRCIRPSNLFRDSLSHAIALHFFAMVCKSSSHILNFRMYSAKKYEVSVLFHFFRRHSYIQKVMKDCENLKFFRYLFIPLNPFFYFTSFRRSYLPIMGIVIFLAFYH